MRRRPLGWTAADEAELQAVAWKLAEAGIEHRDRCAACARLGRYCPPMAVAVDAAIHWMQGRALLSKAQYLRRTEAA